MQVNLFNAMEREVNKSVHHYQTDYFDYDIPYLLRYGKPKSQFIWMLRDCGTHLFRKESLTVLNETFNALGIFTYYDGTPTRIFLITIDANDGKEMIGTIKRMTYDKVIDYIKENQFKPKQIAVSYKGETLYLDCNSIIDKSQLDIINIIREYFKAPTLGYSDCYLDYIM